MRQLSVNVCCSKRGFEGFKRQGMHAAMVLATRQPMLPEMCAPCCVPQCLSSIHLTGARSPRSNCLEQHTYTQTSLLVQPMVPDPCVPPQAPNLSILTPTPASVKRPTVHPPYPHCVNSSPSILTDYTARPASASASAPKILIIGAQPAQAYSPTQCLQKQGRGGPGTPARTPGGISQATTPAASRRPSHTGGSPWARFSDGKEASSTLPARAVKLDKPDRADKPGKWGRVLPALRTHSHKEPVPGSPAWPSVDEPGAPAGLL